MNWLKKLLAKPSKPEPRIPAPGETWTLDGGSGDPFPPASNAATVRVLDVKDGWVRYYMHDIFPDERMRMSSFLYCYSPPPTDQGDVARKSSASNPVLAKA